jgi:hypothetical protein
MSAHVLHYNGLDVVCRQKQSDSNETETFTKKSGQTLPYICTCALLSFFVTSDDFERGV